MKSGASVLMGARTLGNDAAMDEKDRFTNRACHYARYRPTYPNEMVDAIFKLSALNEPAIIADVGAGTGRLSQLLVERGNMIYGVEPNAAMRKVAEDNLEMFPRFFPVAGSAEETGLPDKSVDLITVGTAFHWFDRNRCKPEFRRILKTEGKAALVWNWRDDEASEFMRAYCSTNRLYSNEEPRAKNDKMDESVYDSFFGRNRYRIMCFRWNQPLDFEALWGRTQSSCYIPLPGHPNHEPLKNALKNLFDRCSENGCVQFAYITELVVGSL